MLRDSDGYIGINGHKVKQLREKLCMSQGELSNMIGISNSTLCKIEQKDIVKSKSTIEKIKKFLTENNIKLDECLIHYKNLI